MHAVLSQPKPDPEGRPSRRERSGERRARILEAARACFGEAGFAGATIEAIAARAGVSNGLLYQFFQGKEQLFEVVLQEIISDWVLTIAPPGGESGADSLAGMFRRSVEFCRSHPLLPALLRGERGLQLSRIQSAASDSVQPHRDLVAGLLRDGVAAGEFRLDLDVTSAADVICLLQSHYSSRAYLNDPTYPDSPGLIEATIRFALDALRR